MNYEVQESNRQAQLVWEVWAKRHPKGEVVRYPGLTAAWSHTQWALMNATIITAPIVDSRDLERRIRTAIEHGRQRDKPWLFACGKEWLPSAEEGKLPEVFTRHGLAQVLSMTGMAAEELLPCTRPATGVELRPVSDSETRCAVGEINAVAYEVPTDWGREVSAAESLWHPEVFGCVVYAKGRPASTATTMILDGVRYVGLVATLTEFRQRGYAEAAMRHSLEAAGSATGIKRTVLHATVMGKPTYERMGYRSVATLNFYMLHQ